MELSRDNIFLTLKLVRDALTEGKPTSPHRVPREVPDTWDYSPYRYL